MILLHTLLVLLFSHFVFFGVSDSRDLICKEKSPLNELLEVTWTLIQRRVKHRKVSDLVSQMLIPSVRDQAQVAFLEDYMFNNMHPYDR